MAKLLPRLQAKWDALGDDVHRSLFNQMKSMSLPFWWHGPTPDDPEIYNNGTLCLVDTGKRVVGVTAWHVWEWYRKRLEIGKPFVCQFGGLTVQPGDLLHADTNGVTTIPLAIAGQIADVAAEFVAAEAIVLDCLQQTPADTKRFAEARRAMMDALAALGRRVRL